MLNYNESILSQLVTDGVLIEIKMKTNKTYKSDAFEVIHATVSDLHEAWGNG